MVSNTLNMELDELVVLLGRLRAEHATDSAYQELRAALPPDWPI
jgi:hypothetical protein